MALLVSAAVFPQGITLAQNKPEIDAVLKAYAAVGAHYTAAYALRTASISGLFCARVMPWGKNRGADQQCHEDQDELLHGNLRWGNIVETIPLTEGETRPCAQGDDPAPMGKRLPSTSCPFPLRLRPGPRSCH